MRYYGEVTTHRRKNQEYKWYNARETKEEKANRYFEAVEMALCIIGVMAVWMYVLYAWFMGVI